MLATPLGFILSLIGLVTDKDKKPAIIGLVAGALMVAFFFILVLC